MKTIMAYNLKQGDMWRWNDGYHFCLILSNPIRRKGFYRGSYPRKASTMYVIWSPVRGVAKIEFNSTAQVERL